MLIKGLNLGKSSKGKPNEWAFGYIFYVELTLMNKQRERQLRDLYGKFTSNKKGKRKDDWMLTLFLLRWSIGVVRSLARMRTWVGRVEDRVIDGSHHNNGEKGNNVKPTRRQDGERKQRQPPQPRSVGPRPMDRVAMVSREPTGQLEADRDDRVRHEKRLNRAGQ